MPLAVLLLGLRPGAHHSFFRQALDEEPLVNRRQAAVVAKIFHRLPVVEEKKGSLLARGKEQLKIPHYLRRKKALGSGLLLLLVVGLAQKSLVDFLNRWEWDLENQNFVEVAADPLSAGCSEIAADSGFAVVAFAVGSGFAAVAGLVPAGLVPVGLVPVGLGPAGLVPVGLVPAGLVPVGLDRARAAETCGAEPAAPDRPAPVCEGSRAAPEVSGEAALFPPATVAPAPFG